MCVDTELCGKIDELNTLVANLPTRFLEVFALILLFYLIIRWVYDLFFHAIAW